MFFDKKKIQSNFNRFSRNYDSLANLQKQVAEKLVNFANSEIRQSKNILDLGSGTGFVGQNILNNKNINFNDKKLFQLDISSQMLKNNLNIGENIFNIEGDIENLSFKKNSFDLVISSLSFQWISDLNSVLKKIRQILKPKSILFFSIFIDGTLCELKESAKELNLNLSVNNFTDLASLKVILEKNFDNSQIILEEIVLDYANVYDLIHSIKHIGASYSDKKSSDILLKKSDFLNLDKFYLKNFNSGNRIKATWKVAYVKCYL